MIWFSDIMCIYMYLEIFKAFRNYFTFLREFIRFLERFSVNMRCFVPAKRPWSLAFNNRISMFWWWRHNAIKHLKWKRIFNKIPCGIRLFKNKTALNVFFQVPDNETGIEAQYDTYQGTFVKVECPGFVTLVFNLTEGSCGTVFGNGVNIETCADGVTTVDRLDGSQLHIDAKGRCYFTIVGMKTQYVVWDSLVESVYCTCAEDDSHLIRQWSWNVLSFLFFLFQAGCRT